MNTINTENALNLIKQSNGKTFSVVYIKKDGTRRLLNGRMGVKKGLTGTGMSYNPASKGLLPVYDMQAKGYRMVTIESIQGLKINKKEYIVTNLPQTETTQVETKTLWQTILGFFK